MTAATVDLGIPGFEDAVLVGAGGFAEVYRAHQPEFERPVAIKVLRRSSLGEHAAERYRRELRALGILSGHPHVVAVYEMGWMDAGAPYLVMEYLPGTLQDRLVELGRLSWAAACGVGTMIASALAFAHDKGVLHRDVKPSNVLVSELGDPKLGDFGIAKLAGGPETASGVVVASVAHAPPEVLAGSRPTESADLYSLCSTVYHLIEGRAPFTSDADESLVPLMARITSEPLPAFTVPDVPDELLELLRTGMAKQAADRHRSAAQLAQAFEAVLEAQGRSVRQTATELRFRVVDSHAGRDTGERSPLPTAVARAHGYAADPGPGETRPRPAIAPRFGTTSLAWRTEAARFDASLELSLHPSFRYVHEPLMPGSGVPFVGNDQLVERLAERIRHSRGGAMLVTGFRGVGKTTVVRRAVASLEPEPGDVVLPIWLNVARPVAGMKDVLLRIIRQLFESLNERELLSRLDPAVQRSLFLAYIRTAVALKETRSDSLEGAGTFGVKLPLGANLGLSRKRTSALASEASYLEYSATDIEHDFLRLVRLLNPDSEHGQRRVRRRWRPSAMLRRNRPLRRVQLIVCLDELDKLTGSEEGWQCLGDLLNGMKNVLAASGAFFIFVGGADLHDEFVRDLGRGNSIYESIFAWHLYVPCLWDGAGPLLSGIRTGEERHEAGLAAVESYLHFKARGLPRRLLQEVNRHVKWDGSTPVLRFGSAAGDEVQFYGWVERQVRGAAARLADEMPDAMSDDRNRLANYYVTDWVLRRRGAPFTVGEILETGNGDGSGADGALDPSLHVDEAAVEALLEHLAKAGIVEKSPTQLDVAPQYWLAEPIRGQMVAFGRAGGGGRAPGKVPGGFLPVRHLEPPPVGEHTVIVAAGEPGDGRVALKPKSTVRPSTQSERDELGEGRYELGEVLAHGTLGTVYRATDRKDGAEVAIKVLESPALRSDNVMRARFFREADIAERIRHPNVLRTLATLEEPDGRLATVMQLVVGPTLARAIERLGRLAPDTAVAIALSLGDAVEHLHDSGLSRFDLRPTNIVLEEESWRPVIVDLGLARRRGFWQDDVTASGVVVGTPDYMAPERLLGDEGDIRSDLFSLGLILYEMLAGFEARDRPANLLEAVRAVGRDDLLETASLPVSPELRAVVETATQREPGARFGSPVSMLNALRSCPEGEAAAVAGPPGDEASGSPATGLADLAPLGRAGGDAAQVTATRGASPSIVVRGHAEAARPEVDGQRCIRGHFNHPEALYCALCGISMASQTTNIVAGERPPLGVLVLDDGTTVSMDVDVVIGRDPGTDPDVASGVAIGLRLEDPDHVISRVHTRIRIDGWTVLVADAGSANGSYYLPYGADSWERLHPSRPRELEAGGRVRIANREVVYESHHVRR